MTNQRALTLLLAGKSIMTFQSRATKNHFTYRVVRCKSKDNLYFCSLLNGPDNTTNYQYFGVIVDREFHTTARARIKPEAKSVRAFTYTLKRLAQNNLQDVDVFHEGRCCRCGRRLTTPESIQNGIGPECIKYMGMSH